MWQFMEYNELAGLINARINEEAMKWHQMRIFIQKWLFEGVEEVLYKDSHEQFAIFCLRNKIMGYLASIMAGKIIANNQKKQLVSLSSINSFAFQILKDCKNNQKSIDEEEVEIFENIDVIKKSCTEIFSMVLTMTPKNKNPYISWQKWIKTALTVYEQDFCSHDYQNPLNESGSIRITKKLMNKKEFVADFNSKLPTIFKTSGFSDIVIERSLAGIESSFCENFLKECKKEKRKNHNPEKNRQMRKAARVWILQEAEIIYS